MNPLIVITGKFVSFLVILSEGSWISNFCRLRENSYMCAVDDEWIRDAFNLYGLDNDCRLYKPAINLILGYEDSSSDSSDGKEHFVVFL